MPPRHQPPIYGTIHELLRLQMGLQTKPNNASGVIAFDDLTFTNAQVGVHHYTVEEVVAGINWDVTMVPIRVFGSSGGTSLAILTEAIKVSRRRPSIPLDLGL